MKVMKFGGTSVGTPARMKEVTKLVTKSGDPVFVVLSAMSGTTNSLVEISNYLYKKNPEGANEVINQLERKYIKHVDELYTTDEMKQKTREFLTSEMNYLRSFTKELFTSFEEKSIVAQGELMSTNMVVNYMQEQTSVSIQELTLSYSTNIFEMGEDGEWVQVYHVNNDVQRIPTTLDQVPDYTQAAFVNAEDERFYQHEGVDFQRTAYVFASFVISFWNSDQGGSTITQQLVKNLTGDDDKSPQRKIREIYRAMQLEKSYSKDEILETYINYIGFGGAASGIEMAAQKYFGKTVSELTLAESACLAAIPQSPEVNNPFAGYYERAYNPVTGTYYTTDNFINTGREANRTRMEYILGQMYSNGAITFDEYQAALNEKLIFTDSPEYAALHPDEEEPLESEADENADGTSWAVDAVINEFADYLMEERGITYQRALTLINTGGYQIYSTVDREMQAYVEEKYSDLNNLLKGMTNQSATTIYRDLDGDGEFTDDENLALQSGFTAIDYSGNILCTVGGIGEKKGSLGTSYANTEPQQPGSAIKPVSTYGFALYHDMISWGTKVLDYPPITNPDTGKPFPAIIVVIDNIASLSSQYTDIMDILNQTSRDGGSLGIYLLITAGNTGSYMFRISQYVKSNHTLQMTDKN